MQKEKKYVYTLFAFLALTLLPLVLVNFIFTENIWMNPLTPEAAADWQLETKGVINIEPRLENRYKSIMLERRLDSVNTVVLGSSTTMSISTDSLAGLGSVYNFSQSSRKTNGIIAEARYISKHTEQLKYLVISLDWALGNIYLSDKVEEFSLIEHEYPKPFLRRVKSELAKIRDAMALPRIIDLATILKTYLAGLFRTGVAPHALFAPYSCQNSIIARDYTSINYGVCSGFRIDGSNMFAGRERIDEHRYAHLMLSFLSPGSFYYETMKKYKGLVNKKYLGELLEVSKSLDANGVKVIFLLPPLLPGLEKGLEARHDVGPYIKLTKQTLLDWARENGQVMIDAGRSEKFGCEFKEFIDGHHTLNSCFNKILGFQPLMQYRAGHLPNKYSAFSIQ